MNGSNILYTMSHLSSVDNTVSFVHLNIKRHRFCRLIIVNFYNNNYWDSYLTCYIIYFEICEYNTVSKFV